MGSLFGKPKIPRAHGVGPRFQVVSPIPATQNRQIRVQPRTHTQNQVQSQIQTRTKTNYKGTVMFLSEDRTAANRLQHTVTLDQRRRIGLVPIGAYKSAALVARLGVAPNEIVMRLHTYGWTEPTGKFAPLAGIWDCTQYTALATGEPNPETTSGPTKIPGVGLIFPLEVVFPAGTRDGKHSPLEPLTHGCEQLEMRILTALGAPSAPSNESKKDPKGPEGPKGPQGPKGPKGPKESKWQAWRRWVDSPSNLSNSDEIVNEFKLFKQFKSIEGTAGMMVELIKQEVDRRSKVIDDLDRASANRPNRPERPERPERPNGTERPERPHRTEPHRTEGTEANAYGARLPRPRSRPKHPKQPKQATPKQPKQPDRTYKLMASTGGISRAREVSRV